jgi:hypothetical protein
MIGVCGLAALLLAATLCAAGTGTCNLATSQEDTCGVRPDLPRIIDLVLIFASYFIASRRVSKERVHTMCCHPTCALSSLANG